MAKSYSQEEESRIIGLGITTPVNSPFVKGTPYYSDTSYPGYDPAGAKAAVKAYARAAGKPLSFTLGYIPDPTVAADRPLPAAALPGGGDEGGAGGDRPERPHQRRRRRQVRGRDLAPVRHGQPRPQLRVLERQHRRQVGISLNIARNNDPRIQTALTTGRQSSDAAARAKAYQSIGEYLAQDLPYTWLGRSVWAVVAKAKVQNFNNPVAPDGSKLIGMASGSTWPTQVWIS